MIFLQIIFPDLSDANIKPIEKSQVTITGIIDDVYRARQQLIVSAIFIKKKIYFEMHLNNGQRTKTKR